MTVVRSLHKRNRVAIFLPVMDLHQSCPFPPSRSYSATPALCSSYICPLTVLQPIYSSPRAFARAVFVPLLLLLSSSLCSIPAGSFWFSSKITSSERLSLTTLLKQVPHSLSPQSPAHRTLSCLQAESLLHNPCN